MDSLSLVGLASGGSQNKWSQKKNTLIKKNEIKNEINGWKKCIEKDAGEKKCGDIQLCAWKPAPAANQYT